MQRALLLFCLVTASIVTADAAQAQRDPFCWQSNGLDEGPEAFYIFARVSEQRAAWAYEEQAEADINRAVTLYRKAALALERAIADQAASAQILQSSGQLRSARNARGAKARYRQRADAYWEAVREAGGSTDPGANNRTFACRSLSEGTATQWQAEAEGHFSEAERLLERIAEIAENETDLRARRERIRPLDRQISERVLQAADALVNAGCLDDEGGLETLLEASSCYDIFAHDPADRDPHPELFVKSAALLREIARRLEDDQ